MTAMTQKTATATLHTNHGDIVVDLFGNHAPVTVENFIGLATGDKDYSTQNAQGEQSGPFYDGSIFHRIIPGFMIQGGDPTGTGRGGPGFQFANEYPTDEMGAQTAKPVTYPRGTVAMANSGPDTNGSQFFLNYDDSQLPPDYTYFAKITDEGMDTLGKIAEAGVEGGASDGAPAEEVRISEATVSR